MPSADPARPNVLFILSDDQGAWALGCAGNSELRTPVLDSLAARGTRFTRFYCASPVCSPARASILTGRIPSQHGVHDWLRAGNSPADGDWGGSGVLIEYLRGQVGYTDVLAANGYVCGLSGKWHLGDSHHPQKGHTYWEVHAKGGGHYYNADMVRGASGPDRAGEVYHEPRYVTDAITDNALRFLDGQAGEDRPFYLGVHYTAPHSPWERAEHPPEIYNAYFDSGLPFDSTPAVPMHPWQINSAPVAYDLESRRAILSGYYAAITAMDANIGRVLARLDADGLTENTLVVFTSDNGMNMGHHGVFGKGNGTFPLNMYETSVTVPFIISRPGSAPAGATNDSLLSQYDLFPTFLDYLGMENPEADRLPGRSFARILRGRTMGTDEPIVVYDEYGPVRMIRDRRWKYVHRYPYGPNELYDEVDDPGEERNLFSDPAHAETVADLRGRLAGWFHRWVDPAVDGVREPATGKGQIGLAGTWGDGHPAHMHDWHYIQSGTQG